jgi:hypothetical protein
VGNIKFPDPSKMLANVDIALDIIGQELTNRAKGKIGSYQAGWAPLAEVTKAHKKTGDSPLLETGEMKDSIESERNGLDLHFGYTDPKAPWQEYGTPKTGWGKGIPPRPVIYPTAIETDFKAGQELLKAIENSI